MIGQLDLKLNLGGRGTVVLDGVDISKVMSRVQIDAGPSAEGGRTSVRLDVPAEILGRMESDILVAIGGLVPEQMIGELETRLGIVPFKREGTVPLAERWARCVGAVSPSRVPPG